MKLSFEKPSDKEQEDIVHASDSILSFMQEKTMSPNVGIAALQRSLAYWASAVRDHLEEKGVSPRFLKEFDDSLHETLLEFYKRTNKLQKEMKVEA